MPSLCLLFVMYVMTVCTGFMCKSNHSNLIHICDICDFATVIIAKTANLPWIGGQVSFHSQSLIDVRLTQEAYTIWQFKDLKKIQRKSPVLARLEIHGGQRFSNSSPNQRS